MVMRGGLVVSAGCALHGARIVCDAMRAVWLHSRAALRCTVRGLFAMRCARAGCDALRAGWLHSLKPKVVVQAAPCFWPWVGLRWIGRRMGGFKEWVGV